MVAVLTSNQGSCMLPMTSLVVLVIYTGVLINALLPERLYLYVYPSTVSVYHVAMPVGHST